MRRRWLWIAAFGLLVGLGLPGCGAGGMVETAVAPVEGPALLFFYTDN